MTENENKKSYRLPERSLREPWPYNSKLLSGNKDASAHRFEAALRVYNRIVEDDSENVLVYLLKGKVLDSLKQEEEAKEAYRQALQCAERAILRDPRNASAYLYKGDALHLLHE